jgi:hypothetical protein
LLETFTHERWDLVTAEFPILVGIGTFHHLSKELTTAETSLTSTETCSLAAGSQR